MTQNCTKCGGELKVDGMGFKCIFCGARFASAEELRPKHIKQPTPQTCPTAVPTNPKSDHGVDVFDTNINGVLEITWIDGQYKHSGSGFLISPNGYAVTNTHVVTYENGKSCRQVNVRICGETTTANVMRLGDNNRGDGNGVDLALIKLSRVPHNATIVKFEDFNNVKSGERVFVIGNSLGHGTCITSGIVSDKMRSVNGKMLLMTDCAINGGNSGGPIFNEKGLVIGAVVSGITSAEGMNFAIPSSTVIQFIQNASDVSPMQQVPEKENPYERSEEPVPFGGMYTGKPTPPPPPPRPSLAPCPDCGASATIDGNFIVCDEDPDHVHPAN